MKKRVYIRVLALMLAFVFTTLFVSFPASAEVINGKATLAKSYNKDGKFCMAIDFNFVNDGALTFEIFLTDEGGNVYTRWDNIMVNYTSGTKQYIFSRSYADTPTGLYKLNVVASTQYGDSRNYSFTINHKKVATVTFKDTFMVKNADGTYSQRFRFTTIGGKDKTYYLELYTNNGNYITSFQTNGMYDKSTWSEDWNYYPDSGTRMKSGTYILKYWIEGGNPKQTTVKITI